MNTPLMQFFMYACMILISWLGTRSIVASGEVEFHDVGFRYASTADHQAPDHIDLHFRSGETVGIGAAPDILPR